MSYDQETRTYRTDKHGQPGTIKRHATLRYYSDERMFVVSLFAKDNKYCHTELSSASVAACNDDTFDGGPDMFSTMCAYSGSSVKRLYEYPGKFVAWACEFAMRYHACRALTFTPGLWCTHEVRIVELHWFYGDMHSKTATFMSTSESKSSKGGHPWIVDLVQYGARLSPLRPSFVQYVLTVLDRRQQIPHTVALQALTAATLLHVQQNMADVWRRRAHFLESTTDRFLFIDEARRISS